MSTSVGDGIRSEDSPSELSVPLATTAFDTATHATAGHVFKLPGCDIALSLSLPALGARGCFRGLVYDEPVAELSISTPLALFGRSVRHILDTGRNFIVGFEVHGISDFNMTVEARPAWIVGKAGRIDAKVEQFQAFGELVSEFIGLIELLFLSRR